MGASEGTRRELMKARIVFGLLAALRLGAQTVEVRTEFLRVDPQGKVLTSDATPSPREILSPALVRNGFTSFQVIVRTTKPISYFLLTGANPANVLRATLYKEEFVKRGEDWIPDTLQLLKPPNYGLIPDPESSAPDQRAAVFLLDVWVPPETPAGTVRLEVQLKVGEWIIYPMEVRILPARVPRVTRVADALPEIEERADEAAMAPLLTFLKSGAAGPTPKDRGEPRTLREVIRRNAEQDMALARALDSKTLLPAIKQKMAPASMGGEWYLGVRDLIYRLSSR